MSERLMNPEHPYRKPECSKLAEQIIQLKRQLTEQLDQDGKGQLEQLADAYLNQSNLLLTDAFYDGFCAAVSLTLDYLNWN